MSDDPLLQPYRLKHLTLKNRIMTTAHEPAYAEDGMPKALYRAYHVERARAGIALTMTAGSASVARDSPPAFNNILAYKDEVVPWLRDFADACREHGAAVMIQLTHLGRRTRWDKDDWLPVVVALAPARGRPSRFPQTHRGLGHRAHRRRLRRRRRAGEGGRARRDRTRGLWPPHRPVLVAADQRLGRALWRRAGQPAALRLRGARRHSRAGRAGLYRGHALYG